MERNPLKFYRMSEAGQTVIEYILMLLVMVTIITSLFATVKRNFLGDATQCAKPANSKKLLCKTSGFLEPLGEGKKFQYYPYKK